MPRIIALIAEVKPLSHRVANLEEELARAKLHRFAPCGEKHIDRLFNEAENAADEDDSDDGKPERKMAGGRSRHEDIAVRAVQPRKSSSRINRSSKWTYTPT